MVTSIDKNKKTKGKVMIKRTQFQDSPRSLLLNEVDRVKKEAEKKRKERIAYMKQWVEDMCEKMGGEKEIGVWVNGEWANLWPISFHRSSKNIRWETTVNDVMFRLNENGYVVFSETANRALFFLKCDDKGLDFSEEKYNESTPFFPTKDNVSRLLSDPRLWDMEKKPLNNFPMTPTTLLLAILVLVLVLIFN